MTPEQRDQLATEVMGWTKEKRHDAFVGAQYYYRQSESTAILTNHFHPDTDLNQALPLLDAFNEKKPLIEKMFIKNFHDFQGDSNPYLIYRYSAKDSTQVRYMRFTLTKDLASDLCIAILERLNVKKEG